MNSSKETKKSTVNKRKHIVMMEEAMTIAVSDESVDSDLNIDIGTSARPTSTKATANLWT
jgi:hypothetical protein